MIKLSILALASFAFVGFAQADVEEHTGEGTFYDYSNGGGNCSFPVPDDIKTAAMNHKDYADSATCGGVIVVTNTDNNMSVTVRIDDQCPECAEGDVDLIPEAFEEIALPVTGRIPIKWHYVRNPVAGNLKLFFKDGSSQYWTAIQVRDHLYPITQLEYRRSNYGLEYTKVNREDYNYFVYPDGFGVGPYDFRLTDFCGQSIEVLSIPFSETVEIDTGIQFPQSDTCETGNSNDASGNSDSGNTDTGNSDTNVSVSNSATSAGGLGGYFLLLSLALFRFRLKLN